MEVIGIINSLSFLLTTLYVIVIIAFIRGWYKLSYNKTNDKQASTRVSILVAARNEEANIGKMIGDLLAQNYAKDLIEIVIINDHSTDRTAEIVGSFSNQGVKLINLNEDKPLNSYKKKAIQVAISKTKGELIITTDADCKMGPSWVKTIVNYYETHHYKMISAPVAYFEEKNLFEKCQSLEFSYLIGLGAATIGNGQPSTCNGANLAYERKAFEEVGGFKGIDDLASGDDELLLHKMVARYGHKIGFLKNRDAIVYTYAKPNLKELLQQRKRWASKSTKYKDKRIVALGISIWLFNLSIIANAILALFFPLHFFWQILLFQFLVKNIIEAVFLIDIMSFFKRKQLLVLLPLLNIVHILYMVYIGVAGNSGKYNWKDRMVR
ncbi:MAG: glycosyltransferase [Bacteroidota bacterium]